jgi:hypothetical protein
MGRVRDEHGDGWFNNPIRRVTARSDLCAVGTRCRGSVT